MARLKLGIFGPITGKLGALVGSSWMGIPYLKKAAIINKGKKRSPAQIANNKKFAFVNDWLIPFHPFLTIGFESLAIRQTAIGAALSALYKTMFIGIMPDLVIDHTKMQISAGELRGLKDVTIQFRDPNHINVLWNENLGGNAKFDDQVMLALYSEELKLTDGFLCNVSRIDKKHSFPPLAEMIGQTVHVYMAVVSYNRKKSSNTSYLGQIKLT